MNFLLLTSDIKEVILSFVNEPRDVIKFLVSHKTAYRTSIISKYRKNTLDKIKRLIKVFQHDCYYDVMNTIKTNKDLQNKHFDMFINGYQDINLIKSETDLSIYNAEISLLATKCMCNTLDFLNLMRLSNSVDIPRYNTLRATGIEKLFLAKRFEDYDDTLIIEFDSGIEIFIKCNHAFIDINNCEFRFIEVAIKTKTFHHSYHYELSNYSGYNETTWIDHFMFILDLEIPSTILFGKIVNINYYSEYAYLWRTAYFLIEKLHIYNSLMK
jgi:hypothetical protein